MKILIYGAGLIGCTYAWQLQKVGYDITLLVRKGKKQPIEEKGINIHYTDYRNNNKKEEDILFRPKVLDSLPTDHDFEYIIVTTDHLDDEILSNLKMGIGKAHILFFQNLWYDDLEKIDTYFSPEQYFLGFPFMAGGGRVNDIIDTIILGSKYSKTMLGERDGVITPRVKKIADAMGKADMKPFVSDQIVAWLLPHYAFIAAISGGIIQAGGTMEAFIKDPKRIKSAIKAIREGFSICSAKGINPKKEKVNQLYYFPLFIAVPVVKKVFGDEAMQAMVDGYLKTSGQHILRMIEGVRHTAKILNLQTPYLDQLHDELKA